MRRFTLLALLVFALPAFGQPQVGGGYYGLAGSPGVGIGPGWGWGVGPWWGWPYWNGGVNGSFYSNGMSLYAQPVPQPGGITPGFFGGSDLARQYWNAPPGLGLGWWGYRSPLPNAHGAARDFPQNPLPADYNGPRFATRDVKARYAWVKANPAAESALQMQDLNRANYGIRLYVILPEGDCSIYLQGQPMSGEGRVRFFESPPLPQGSEYKYTVVAKLPGDRAETREVTGRPGDTLKVDFTATP